MEIRNVGRSGLRVSVVGVGCNQFGGKVDLEGTRRVVHKALDLGITLFDTADSYGNRGGSETLLGQALGTRRKDIVLATKFGWAMDDVGVLKGGARRYVMAAVEDSLRRLKTDWIDLYQFHTPDPLTPIDETLRALDDLVRQGKVRYIGCSNMTGWQLADAMWTSRHHDLAGFVSAQNEYNVISRGIEAELVPAVQHYGLGVLPYYPLASGLLTGKYRRGAPLPANSRLTDVKRSADRFLTTGNWEAAERLQKFCDARSHSLVELAFGWLAARPYVSSIIAGATTPEQIEANVRAVQWKLTPADVAEIDKALGA